MAIGRVDVRAAKDPAPIDDFDTFESNQRLTKKAFDRTAPDSRPNYGSRVCASSALRRLGRNNIGKGIRVESYSHR
jgi:hypothetical protein